MYATSLLDMKVGDLTFVRHLDLDTGTHPVVTKVRVDHIARVGEGFAPAWVRVEWLDTGGFAMIVHPEDDLVFDADLYVEENLGPVSVSDEADEVDAIVAPASVVEIEPPPPEEAVEPEPEPEPEPFSAEAFLAALTPEQEREVHALLAERHGPRRLSRVKKA